MVTKNKEKALLKYSRYMALILSGKEDDIEGAIADIFYTAYRAGFKDGKEEAIDTILGKMAITIDKYIRDGES